MSDGIIGSVGVAVVPDATGFWERFRAQTSAGAAEAGRNAGNDWQRGFEGATRGTNVRIGADTSKARAEIAALNKETGHSGGLFEKLIKTAVTLSPALVPIGAAAAAAGADFAALGAVGILAVKGLSDQMKAATPVGAEVTGMLHSLKSGLDEVEASAAKGALPGFQQSVAKLRTELPQLNTVVSQQAVMLGDVVSHLTGGLIGGFSTFAPLLSQVSGSVDRIATHFEMWATGPGGAKFSATLGADYARVAPIIDDLAHAIEHLIVAAHPVGLGILTELQLLARVVSSFPTPALNVIVAGFVSFRTVNAISGVVTSISAGFAKLSAQTEATAASVTASNLQLQASAAAAAAQVAETQAAEATAVAAAQREIAASLAGTGSVLEASAAEAALASEAEAASFQAAAVAAAASAAEIGDAAATAAAASEAAGAASGAGWAAMLGPIGIAVGVVALLGLTFLNTSKDTQAATQATQDFTTALTATNGAITDNIRNQVSAKLAQQGLIDQGKQYGLSTAVLTDYVLGAADAQDKVNAAISAAAAPTGKLVDSNGKVSKSWADSSIKAGKLRSSLQTLASGFASARAEQEATAKATQGFGSATDYTTQQIANGNTALRGWVTAVDAFNKSSDTAADRAKLIGAALVAANGDALAYAGSLAGTTTAIDALTGAFQQQREQLAQQSASQQKALNGVASARNSASSATARVAAAEAKLADVRGKWNATNAQIASAEAAVTAARNSAANAASRVGSAETSANRAMALSYGDTERAAIKFRDTQHGLRASIDTTAKGAGDLISQLQAIQTAAENAAEATYQHDLRLKGAKQAADEAYTVYRSKTEGALVDEATKLHLTGRQAKALADQYFGIKNSGDIKKRIELLGEDKVVRALKGILQDLDILAGKTTILDIQINAANRNAPTPSGNPIPAPQGPGTGGPARVAAMGTIVRQGAGPHIDDQHYRLARGEAVIPAAAVAANLPLVTSLIASGRGLNMGGLIPTGSGVYIAKVEQTTVNPLPEPVSATERKSGRRLALALGSYVPA